MQSALIVFPGAGIGGVLRHGVNIGCARLCATAFPWGTLTVNVAGSLVMGLMAGWLASVAQVGSAQPLRLFLLTGILGGFTTFSAFSMDAVLLWERGEPALAGGYVLGSVFVSIAALAAGLAIIRTLL